MALHRRSHVTEAIAQQQNETTVSVTGAVVDTVIPIAGIKSADELVKVFGETTGTSYARYSIFVPTAGAIFGFNGANPSAGDYVTVSAFNFIFTDTNGQAVEENYPAGSNASNRRFVTIGSTTSDTADNLVQSINDMWEGEGDVAAFRAEKVPADAVRVLSKAEGDAGVGFAVSASSDWGYGGGGGWKDLDLGAPVTYLTLQPSNADEGIISSLDDSSAEIANTLKVSYQPFQNNDTISKAVLDNAFTAPAIVGNYGPGDAPYDSAAGDPENVGYGPGRMPPGWQP